MPLADTEVTGTQTTFKPLLPVVTYTLSDVVSGDGLDGVYSPIVVAVTVLPLRANLAVVIISGRPKLMVLALDTLAR